MNYKKINVTLGWLAFIIATVVYFLTVEQTASLWDCGEYITAAYKLEVGHPPGAPFFMIIGRLFSLFAGSETEVALWINRMSALCSSFSILFLFWTITMLGKKIAQKESAIMTKGQQIAILGSGFVGAMAYTFTDSFWFSAVEGEVYAMSSLFTAIIFWAVLKWDEEMTLIKRGQLDPVVRPLRWMILIMFLFGLAIGVHLLGLLVIPAIAYVAMFQMKDKINTKLFILTGIVGVAILAFIQNGVIPGTIALASNMEIFFVNSMGLPFGFGAAFFFILLVGFLVGGLLFTRKRGYKVGSTIILGLIMLFIGYGSFATIVIRSNANPPLDENNPENLVTLHSYLKREQYGSWPILYGEYYNSKTKDQSEFGDRSPNYNHRWAVQTRSGKVITSFLDKDMAEKYKANSGKPYELIEKYVITNESIRKKQVRKYAQNTLFPRMYFRGDSRRSAGYRNWSGYNPNRKVRRNETGIDGKPIPTFGDNISFFVNYQVGWMYWRYFMWNFSGRQNDIQGHGDEMRGNWISGFGVVDDARLGVQGENAPFFTKENPSNNTFYFIPLILGLLGLFFHFLKAPKDAFVVMLLFLFTGIAVVVYLNQKPYEPRERDYAYAASFYLFAIWVGLGVYALFEAFRSFGKEEYKKLGITFGGLFLLCLLADAGSSTGLSTTISLLIIGAIGGGGLLLMTLLRKVKFPHQGVASFAILLGLTAPLILGFQNWDDHDRSNRTPAQSLAHNYLTGCSPNSILFTNGDNDTFPLWYLQEVEGERTDVRVANLSLMQTDWYTNQMTMRAYESDPLPIKFRENQILMGDGNTDQTMFVDFESYKRRISKEKGEEIMQIKINANPSRFKQSITQIKSGLSRMMFAFKATDGKTQNLLGKIKEELETPSPNPGYRDYKLINEIIYRILDDERKGKITADKSMLTQLKKAAESWTKSWDYLPIDYAMEFVRNDENMMDLQQGRKLRYFPSTGFILPVNTENAVKAGIISEEYADQSKDEIRFDFNKGGLFRSDVRALTREETMMLDILANFDWKRGIYFSSPAGSNVSKALYARGAIQNYGQIHGLSPLKNQQAGDFSKEEMYDNIMNKYDYANLSGEGVLVDYYTRRHTNQYRNSFIALAENYLQDYKAVKKKIKKDSIPNVENTKKAEVLAGKINEVISYSLEKLPISKVFDFGTPRSMGRSSLSNNQDAYQDGSIPKYIGVLYESGNTETANKLSMEYLKQLETMMNYFQKSDPLLALRNKKDFIAFTMNFLRTYAQIYRTAPKSEARMYGEQLMQRLNKKVVGKIVREVSQLKTVDTGSRGRTRERYMEKEAQEFADLYQSMLEKSGFANDAASQE